ncbi:hypothetical protein OG783_22750 [Streptomyces jietaisiensis]|uniref:beta/gamma crystallin domain-containing protein n=1 Tax=Streptomyces griseoaurantiacus TaxID=68213 RepID=UPI003247184E
MQRSARRLVLAGLASAALMTSLTVGATSASAISVVQCGPPDYLKITVHFGNLPSREYCYALKGEMSMPLPNGWVTRIETGNNRVQWHGDDNKWQPSEEGIKKWTTYVWPNHPGGVKIDAIKIL